MNIDLTIANKYKIFTSLAAGASAGALAKSTIAPLDRCKISFQVSHQPYSFVAAYRFLADSYKNHGLLFLWRGNSATMMRVVPFAALQFCAHEQWRRVLAVDVHSRPTPLRRYLAGSLAGVTATSLTYPLDLARARLAVSTKAQYKSLSDVFVKAWRFEGPLSLFRGLTPTLMGVIPYAGTSFFTYETLKLLHHDKTGRRVTTGERMVFGACSGLVGQSASYPLDIVRRRMQTHPNVHGQKSSVLKIAKNIIQTEGIVGGLYKGLSMNWIKGPIAVSISFTTFDTILRFLRSLDFFQQKNFR